MKAGIRLLITFCILAVAGVIGAPAYAQATRTWVSGVGDDVNPCSRTAPCKTFAGAISKTAASGEINCIDSGAYGTVTITKSIVIRCDDVQAGVLSSGTSGVIVNAAATDRVTLSGLDIEGGGTGINGIRFLNGAALHVENVVIHGFRTAGSNGILFAPTTGDSQLYVSNTIISDNGDGTNGPAIHILPTGTAKVRATINNTVLTNNTHGLISNTGAATLANTARVTFTDGVSAGNNTATGNSGVGVAVIAAATPNAVNRILVLRSAITNNGFGLIANGQGSGILAALNGVNGNVLGVQTVSSGVVVSYGNNFVNANTSADGSFSATISPL